MAQSKHLQSMIAATGASGSWDWDVADDTLYVDDRFAELYGFGAAEAASGVPTRRFFSAIHPEDRARIQIAVAGILGGAELFSKEFRIVASDGSVLWMHGRGQCHRDERDEPVRFTGLLVDVTERRRAEERLRIAQSAGGVGTFEYVDGHATANVSNEFCRLLGLHPAAALPVQTINGVLSDGSEQLIPDPRNRQAPATLDAVFKITRPDDDTERWIARRGEIVPEGSGYRLIGVIYDVTASKELEAALRDLNETLEVRVQQEVAIRRETEDALRQAQKMEAIGQLTGGIAHDFNNLLMAISSSLYLLRKRLPPDPAIERLIDNGLQGAERGAALTQRMLAFARRQDLTVEPVSLPVLIQGMTDLIQRTIGPAWALDLGVPADIPPVVADANQLELALLNLAVNARDALPSGGVITLTAERVEVGAEGYHGLGEGAYVKLSVADRGSGMDDATLARAMEPFFTTKGVGKGTGLGLSMIHGLAQQLGGTFVLQSAPGAGTVASLWLPVSDQEITKTPAETPADATLSGPRLRIVAVDDDALILMNVCVFLEEMGHEVLEARSGDAALKLVEANPDLDLLITDQAMPNMTGAELVERIAADRPDLPVILATGYGELPAGLHHRVTRLAKPFSEPELAAAVRAAARTENAAAVDGSR